ncbi:MAG: GNAT family N-acetyltransferase [Flavobacteriaceae bacterium]|jgi:GNAT superfamily N-acetyltransferase|nr:GNAT family N-acetyltransferase [Flavobacteriaceae bacterium]
MIFRKAIPEDIPEIWEILRQAIRRRKKDGSKQWQDGYPNLETVETDIKNGVGYVLADSEKIIGYSAVIFNDEPAYENINGKWLSDGDFVVVHRVAISDEHSGKGLAQKMFDFIEKIALGNNIHSIKADTNFDNIPMLKTLEKSGYQYCGEVFLRGNPRKAFEKII